MHRKHLVTQILISTLVLGRATGYSLAGEPSTPTSETQNVSLTALGPGAKLAVPSPDARKWASSDPTVATVAGGWVFGKKAGITTVTASGGDGAPAKFTVTVKTGATLAPAPEEPGRVQGFVTREGNQLMENGKPFRFISWNVPNLHIIEDASWLQQTKLPKGQEPIFWHRITRFEQEDAVKAVAEMGGTVIRCYTLSSKGGRRNANGPSHYNGPDSPLDEDLMKDYDQMIAICGQHGVRLILPFVDEWDWFGGRKEFAKLNGGGDFYTTRTVVDHFKDLIAALVNRVNTVTGVAYKDDPAIMAWETGNELQHVPRAWTAEIAAWIKEKAPKQLVSDGANGSIESIDDPNVDMVTDHYYGGKDYLDRAMRDRVRMGTKKPFFIGEFGCADPDVELGTFDATLHNGIVGALFWSLRFHSSDGGFYWHDEGKENSAYHWPGFASNARSDEIRVLRMMREKAWAIRGYLPPARQKPEAPVLLPTCTRSSIVWMGSAGAELYELERSLDGVTWTSVAKDLSDAAQPFQPYEDAGAPAKELVQYRLRAVNVAGASPWSAVLTIKAP